MGYRPSRPDFACGGGWSNRSIDFPCCRERYLNSHDIPLLKGLSVLMPTRTLSQTAHNSTELIYLLRATCAIEARCSPPGRARFERLLRPNIAVDAMNSGTYGELPFEVPQIESTIHEYG